MEDGNANAARRGNEVRVCYLYVEALTRASYMFFTPFD